MRDRYQNKQAVKGNLEGADYAGDRRKQNKINHKINKHVNVKWEAIAFIKKNRILQKIKIIR